MTNWYRHRHTPVLRQRIIADLGLDMRVLVSTTKGVVLGCLGYFMLMIPQALNH